MSREQAAFAFPQFKELICADGEIADSTWNSSLSTGKLLEFISLLVVLDVLKEIKATVEIDDFFWRKPDCFYLRNEIPYHHEAQAGHEGHLLHHIPLLDRFIAAITPRAKISFEGKSFLLYREGIPLHLVWHIIKYGELYRIRPDLALVAGNIIINTNITGTITYIHEDHNSKACTEISIKNSNIIPIKKHNANNNYKVNTVGVIECSVSKTKVNADSQLDAYKTLFSISDLCPALLFINGGKEISNYSTINVNQSDIIKSINSQSSRALIALFLKDALLL